MHNAEPDSQELHGKEENRTSRPGANKQLEQEPQGGGA